MTLTQELKDLLYEQGAALVGMGDMRQVEGCSYPVGISIAIPLPVHITLDLQKEPTKEYYDMYYTLNRKLNEVVLAGEAFLTDRGYKAWAQTTDRVKVNENKVSVLPHKTVATRAGVGWIGKNCLLVTPQYGSAVRLSSLLTDAPLECDEPYNESKCGACKLCVSNCPAQALKGTLWNPKVQRAEIVDIPKCYQKQVEIMTRATGIETDLCGKCFAVCAYTRKYIATQK